MLAIHFTLCLSASRALQSQQHGSKHFHGRADEHSGQGFKPWASSWWLAPLPLLSWRHQRFLPTQMDGNLLLHFLCQLLRLPTHGNPRNVSLFSGLLCTSIASSSSMSYRTNSQHSGIWWGSGQRTSIPSFQMHHHPPRKAVCLSVCLYICLSDALPISPVRHC